MRKQIFCAAVLLICALTACAAHAQEFIYGGSGVDAVYQAAAAPDERIIMTGYTSSTDGTLAGRTGSGQAGWALCVDATGNVLWNFTTQLSRYDTLCYPVFRGDGSVTMLANTSPAGAYEVWWLHVDAQGNLIDKKRLRSETGSCIARGWGVEDAYQSGYVVSVFDKKKATQRCYKYTFDGEFVWEIPATEEPYFPETHLFDSTRVYAENTEDEAQDVRLRLDWPHVGLPESGFYDFQVMPYLLREQIEAAVPGAEVIASYGDRMAGRWRYLVALLEDAQGYVLCCGVYGEDDWQLEFSRTAILPGTTPEIIPEGVSRAFTPDTIAAAGGCAFFDLVCGDVTMEWGYQERWGRFTLGKTVLPGGETIHVAGDTLWADNQGVHVYHDFGYSLSDFDASRLPNTIAEAAARAQSMPQGDRRLARLNSHDNATPHIPMHMEPSENSPVLANYLMGVDGEALEEKDGYVRVRIGDMQGWILRACVLMGSERAMLDYDKGGYPGLVYGGFENHSRPLLDGPGGGAILQLAPGTPVEILGSPAGTQVLQVRLADGTVGFMDDTQVLQGFRHTDSYTLRVTPQDGSDQALLYSQPDEKSAPIGACLAGDEVGRLVEQRDTMGWLRVIIEGYAGYMRAEDLISADAFTQMP